MKKEKVKTIKVPILTEEYKIIVAIGSNEALAKYISKNVDGWSYYEALEQCKNTRGSCYNRLKAKDPKHPLITLDGDLPFMLSLCTLPHEASHAAGDIMEYLNIQDPTDEFRGQVISAVMRHCIKEIFPEPHPTNN